MGNIRNLARISAWRVVFGVIVSIKPIKVSLPRNISNCERKSRYEEKQVTKLVVVMVTEKWVLLTIAVIMLFLLYLYLQSIGEYSSALKIAQSSCRELGLITWP